MKQQTLAALIAAGACVFLGGGAAAQQTALSGMDRQFLVKASQGNHAEIMTSELALKRASNQKVRGFAEHMIRDHRQAQNDLRQLARQKGVSVPAEPDAEQKAMHRQLSRLSGAQFDRMYMQGQVRAHNASVALFRKQMEQGEDADVRNYAAEYLPPIQDHTKMAHAIAHDIGALRAAPGARRGQGAGARDQDRGRMQGQGQGRGRGQGQGHGQGRGRGQGRGQGQGHGSR